MRRPDLQRAISDLSDPDYQWRVWVGGQPEPDASYTTLDMCIHILYDDLQVLPDPQARVGVVIVKEEAAALSILEAALGPLIDELGDVPDVAYLNHQRWSTVVQAARAARTVLRGEPLGADS